MRKERQMREGEVSPALSTSEKTLDGCRLRAPASTGGGATGHAGRAVVAEICLLRAAAGVGIRET